MVLFDKIFKRSRLNVAATTGSANENESFPKKDSEIDPEEKQVKVLNDEDTLSILKEIRKNVLNAGDKSCNEVLNSKQDEMPHNDYLFDLDQNVNEEELFFENDDVVDFDSIIDVDAVDEEGDVDLSDAGEEKYISNREVILQLLDSAREISELPLEDKETLIDVVNRINLLEKLTDSPDIRRIQSKCENEYSNAETLLDNGDYGSIIPVRKEIYEGFDKIQSQLNRLKSIFQSKPYPPLHVVRFYVKKLLGALPFDETNKVDNKTSISMNHLLVSAEINQKHFQKLKNDLNDIGYVKNDINGFKISPTCKKFRTQVLGLNFQKKLLLQLVREKAKIHSQDAFKSKQLNFREEELTSKQKNIVSRFEKAHKPAYTDREWFNIFSVELEEKPDRFKIPYWYNEIEGIGDVSAEFIENYIFDNYSDSASAFVISLIRLLREERGRTNFWEPNYDQDGIHDIWLLFKEEIKKQ